LGGCFAVAPDGHTILAGGGSRYPLLAANPDPMRPPRSLGGYARHNIGPKYEEETVVPKHSLQGLRPAVMSRHFWPELRATFQKRADRPAIAF